MDFIDIAKFRRSGVMRSLPQKPKETPKDSDLRNKKHCDIADNIMSITILEGSRHNG